MKNNLLWSLIVLLLFVSLPYFIKQYEDDDEVVEGFKGGRGGGRRGGGRRGGDRRGGGRGPGRRMVRRGGRGWRQGWRRPRFYRRSSYRRYPYYYGGYGGYGYPYYSTYDTLGLPYLWGSPYGYATDYNWFDFRNCPPGCVANSGSPSGFSCVGSNTGASCLSDYDCSGCNYPTLTYY